MDVTREDIDNILYSLELHGTPAVHVETLRAYLDKTDEVLKMHRGEVPLFGRR